MLLCLHARRALASACLLAAFGLGCGQGAATDEGPVVIVGVDGMAWEVIAPLLAGAEYPSIAWGESSSLTDHQGWTASRLGSPRPASSFDGDLLLLEDRTSPLPDEPSRTLDLDPERADRYRIEGRVRAAAGSDVRFTLAVRYLYAGEPPRSDGNNETVCKSFDLSDRWQEVRLDLQPPIPAERLSILLLPGKVDCVDGQFERVAAPGEGRQSVELRDLRLVAGKLRGLPEGGFDAADLDPATSLLPTISRLVANGVSGYLRTLEPAMSPVIWTSVVTGETPEEHGIEGFLMPTPGGRGSILAASTLRRVPALWNIVTDYGDKSVGVTSWWASWPAESVRGFMVTDHANEAAIRILKDRGQLPQDAQLRRVYAEYDTYPRELAERLRPTAGTTLTREDLARLIPDLDDATWDRFARSEHLERSDLFSILKFYLLKDLGTFRSTLPLFEESRPDLWMLYFNGQDSAQHRFWHWQDPDLYPRVDGSRTALLGRVIENYYRMVDGFIARILAAAGPRANVLIISDHGVRPVDFMQSGSKSGGHNWKSPGVLIAAGPAFKRGHQARHASIFDIAPTVLDLLGYPVAAGIEGKPLIELLDRDWKSSHPTKRIAEYRFLSPRLGTDVPVDTAFEEDVKARLRALGYLQ